jgi:cobalt-zinc-cadmium efflux system membrane fusion protein
VVGGKTHTWSYQSYEGRTTIEPSAAKDAGVVVEEATAGTIRDTVTLMGNIAVNTGRQAAVKARFPGIVRSVSVEMGQRVSAGRRWRRLKAMTACAPTR